MRSNWNSDSEAQTSHWGKQLGQVISNGCLIFLQGTLGAGKTRFVQAVAAGLNIDPNTVTSPTFTIMVPYTGRLRLVHVDAYRINDLDEAEQLGLDDWLADGCVMMIEWPERIDAALPSPDLIISIEQTGQTSRQFTIQAITTIGVEILNAFTSEGPSDESIS